MKQIIFIISIILLSESCQEKRTENENGLHFSKERLELLDSFIIKSLNNRKAAGIEVLLYKQDKTEYHKAFGVANIEQNFSLQKNSIYRLASMTKFVVSIAVMQLYEQGHFMLNDPISNYIPEFENMQQMVDDDGQVHLIPCNKPILIRHLMSHTSGISYSNKYYKELELLKDNKTIDDFVIKLSKAPLLCEPGKKICYGYSTNVLLYLIERITNKSFREYMLENITLPMQMEDTDFYVPEDKLSRLPNFYEHRNDSLELRIETNAMETELPKIMWADGNLYSSTLDYLKLLQMVLNNGNYKGKQILSYKSVELLKTVQKEIASEDAVGGLIGQGIGMGLSTGIISNIELYGELGSEGTIFWEGNKGTRFWIDFNEGICGLIMMQTTNVLRLKQQIQKLSYQALTEL